ncbi:hypothetical protein D1007_42232 [Hordeum vulgare]|nr:hypothetical protein D1007_42232 [Hordeum vulgare]
MIEPVLLPSPLLPSSFSTAAAELSFSATSWVEHSFTVAAAYVAKLVDGSLQDTERDKIVKWEVEFAEIDPQEMQSMEERVVKNVVEKNWESIFWGPDEMANFFGIPVDDQDKEERDKSSLPSDPNKDACEDVDEQLMKDVADDVDDAHDDELLNVYDKENHVIEVGKMFPNMIEFRMCFKTYALKHEFDAKTVWTDGKNFYAKCGGFDGNVKPCK